MDTNPYAPPGRVYATGETLADRYRVDRSKLTLKELRDLSGYRILSAAYWMLLKIGLTPRDKQIIDAPKPFLDDYCEMDDIPEPVRSYLVDNAKIATELGFYEPRPAVSHTTGIESCGGAIRMLHKSAGMFINIAAGSQGRFMQGELQLVSASDLREGLETYATTNGRPGFERPQNVHAQYFRDADLNTLIREHRGWVDSLSQPMLRFSNYDDVARIMDYLSVIFFQRQIARGVLVPVP